MDHYEELGLTRTASEEEIRQAYRRVARLLHPDRCKDEESRSLADLQMKRLNGILEILTDSAARLSYDERLIGPSPTLTRPRHLRPGLWVWLLSCCILLSAFILIVTRQSERRGVSGVLSSVGAPTPAEKPSTPMRHAGRISSMRALPRAAALPVEQTALLPPPSEITSPAPPELPVILPPLAAPMPLSSSIDRARERLAGEWLYVPSGNAKHGELYPPEYIELRLTEESGGLAGKYRARYRVSDRAISPNVVFQFLGPAEPGGGRMAWTGAGGARGQLTLRRLDDGSLEVSWTADQLGTDLGLVSGTATLVRKQE